MVGNLRYASTYPSQRAAAVTKVHKGGVVLLQNVITGILSLLLWTFSLITFVCLGICFVCLSFLLPPRWLHPVARAVSRGILFTAGQRLKQTGTFPDHKDGPYIYMFNHTSLLDTFVVMALIPEFTGAIGKAEQFSIPIWGWILKRWGAVPIERGHLSTAIDQLSQVEDALRNGTSLLISPEGTRSADGLTLGSTHDQPYWPLRRDPFTWLSIQKQPSSQWLWWGSFMRSARAVGGCRPIRLMYEWHLPLRLRGYMSGIWRVYKLKHALG